MAKTVKCPICKKLNEKEDAIYHGNRYYCKKCFENRPVRDEYWDLLYDYICRLFDISKPTGLIFQQIKNYKSEPYNFTDKGIYLTLKYCYEVLGKNFDTDEKTIGIVPYYYEATKNHYIKINNIEEKIEDIENITNDIKTIKINKVTSSFKNKEIKYQIDWSDEGIDYSRE